MINTNIEKAKDFFYKKDYLNAYKIFSQLSDCMYETGLCALMINNLEEARKCWLKSKSYSPASEFGLYILDCIDLKARQLPSFFQTRAFLEIYLNLFLENNLVKWSENVVGYCEYFAKSNPEAFKFIARALYSNGYFSLAVRFLNKSITICPYDPEALLILSQCEFLLGNRGEALDIINKSLVYAPDFFPSKLMKNIILDDINNKK